MIRINGGSFPENSLGVVTAKGLTITTPDAKVTVYDSIKQLEELDSEVKREWGKKVMWGVGLGIITAGLGLLAILFVGNNKEITFLAEFSDGKTVTGIADKGGFALLGSLAGENQTYPETVQAINRKRR